MPSKSKICRRKRYLLTKLADRRHRRWDLPPAWPLLMHPPYASSRLYLSQHPLQRYLIFELAAARQVELHSGIDYCKLRLRNLHCSINALSSLDNDRHIRKTIASCHPVCIALGRRSSALQRPLASSPSSSRSRVRLWQFGNGSFKVTSHRGNLATVHSKSHRTAAIWQRCIQSHIAPQLRN